MVDAAGAPRRVSMAYILGFSNKPFKDGGPPAPPPPPRHPNAFKQMVTTPGGVIEWAASDGRRGRLTGPGKTRLTNANLAQVPSANMSAKAALKKDPDEEGMGMLGLFDDAPAAVTGAEPANDGKLANATSDWTKEQDEKLMKMKGECKSWAEIAVETGKDQNQCKARFGTIKPKDWRPTKAQGGGDGKQKQGKKGQKDNKEEEKKDEVSGGFFTPAADATWDAGGTAQDNSAWPTSGGDGFAWDTRSGDKNDDNSGNWGDDNNKDGGFQFDDNVWKNTGDSGDTGANGWANTNSGPADAGTLWDTTNGKDDNPGGFTQEGWGNEDKVKDTSNPNDNAIADPWPPAAPAIKSSSRKNSTSHSKRPTSQSGSKPRPSQEPRKSSAAAPLEYELKPDSTFSSDDLRLVARILQQDCQMVWNRVSWRFRDKTGRNLHPDIFEKKITGKIEEGGSAYGRRS